MCKLKYFVFYLILGLLGVASCGDPVAESRAKDERIYQDSLNHAISDNEVIDQYIIDQDLGSYEVTVTSTGLRYLVIDEGSGTKYPKLNDILSVDYFATLADGIPFETTSRQLAMSYDSTVYEEKGVDVGQVMLDQDLNLENALIYLSSTDESLDNPLVSQNKLYGPINYNYTLNGLGTTFVPGFSEGLYKLIPMLSVGGQGVIMIPSAIGYGTLGSSGGVIPGNTPIFFKLYLTNIRP